jgi:competence protein ComEC
MFKIGSIIFCLSYIIALLSTGISSSPVHQFSPQIWIGFCLVVVIITILITIFGPRLWRFGPTRIYWLTAGIIILLSVIYYHLRLPYESFNDISLKLDRFQGNLSSLVQVRGVILTSPQLNRLNKLRFMLQATGFQQSSSHLEEVEGKLYITLSSQQKQFPQLYPSQKVILTGKLYKPSAPKNPGAFDFKTYLWRQGIFAGFTANEIQIQQEGNFLWWGLWNLRHRVIETHQRYLPSPTATLVSSMMLGRRAVKLPYNLQDLFIKVGLAHILAASGFHVSVLLGSVLWLTRNSSPRIRLITGILSLLIYLALTGFYPSILRATIMGTAVLIGINSDRQVNSLATLLFAATILLLINPLWIWNLSFQLSFLATFGLIVTVQPIIKYLDSLPPNIAALIAVSLSCSLWVLPLQSYVFNTIPIYGILLNVIITPLVTIITLGGMISGFVGVIFPLLGSAMAWLLLYPTLLLINIVKFVANLPGNSLAVGKISLLVVFLCYGIFLAIWLINWCQKRWKLISLFLITVIFIPIIYSQFNLVKVTILSTKYEPIIVIQNQGKISLINIGYPDTVKYLVYPFLAHQGLNRIDLLILLKANEQKIKGLEVLLDDIVCDLIFLDTNKLINNDHVHLNLNKPITTKNQQIKLMAVNPTILELNILGQKWLILQGKLARKPDTDLKSDVLVWYGGNIPENWLDSIKPTTAIAYGKSISPSMKQRLRENQIQFYSTHDQGAIQWTPAKKFRSHQSEFAIISD